MDKVSKNALIFFEKYSNGDDSLEFAREFGTLAARLFLRIRKEEQILYAKFEEITAIKKQKNPHHQFPTKFLNAQ